MLNYFAEGTLYGPVHSEVAIDIYKKAVDDAQKQVSQVYYNVLMFAFFELYKIQGQLW